MSHRRGVPALLAVLIAALVAFVAPAASAAPHNATPTSSSTTATAADPCAGRSQTYIVRTFFRGPAVYPLRCGTSSWGYIHLVAGHEYDPSMIALTVAQGTIEPLNVIDYWTQTCPSRGYRVVYNDGALNGTGVRPQGIITAYPLDSASAVAC